MKGSRAEHARDPDPEEDAEEDSRETLDRAANEESDSVDAPHARTYALPPGAHSVCDPRGGTGFRVSTASQTFVSPFSTSTSVPPPPRTGRPRFASAPAAPRGEKRVAARRRRNAFFFRRAPSVSVGRGGVRGLLPSNAAPKRRAFPFPSRAFLRRAESRLQDPDASSSASRTARSSAERSASAGGRGADGFGSENAHTNTGGAFSSFPSGPVGTRARDASLCVRPARGPLPARAGRGRVASEDDEEHSEEASRGGGRGASANVLIRFSAESFPSVPRSRKTDVAATRCEALPTRRVAELLRGPRGDAFAFVRGNASTLAVSPNASPWRVTAPRGSTCGVSDLLSDATSVFLARQHTHFVFFGKRSFGQNPAIQFRARKSRDRRIGRSETRPVGGHTRRTGPRVRLGTSSCPKSGLRRKILLRGSTLRLTRSPAPARGDHAPWARRAARASQSRRSPRRPGQRASPPARRTPPRWRARRKNVP